MCNDQGFDNTQKQIVEALQKLPQLIPDRPHSDKVWTRGVKDKVGKIGEDSGWQVWPDRDDLPPGNWT